MTQEQLVNLVIMSIESYILRDKDFTVVVNDFAMATSRDVSGPSFQTLRVCVCTFEFTILMLTILVIVRYC